MPRSLVIKLTVAAEAAERCVQALTVAATAVASGVSVSLWLTGDSVFFVVPGREPALELAYSPPVADLIAAIGESGRITACTQCVARRDLTQEDLAPGVRIAGAASFLDEALAEGAQALVY